MLHPNSRTDKKKLLRKVHMGEFAGVVVPRTRYLYLSEIVVWPSRRAIWAGLRCPIHRAVRDGIGRGTPVPREKRAAKLWKPLLSSPEKAAV